MQQIVFNQISAAELAELPVALQLELIGKFDMLPEDFSKLSAAPKEQFGVIEREGTQLHRYRAGDYRIYFQTAGETITIHRILHKNTIRDFLFRSKLPLAEDEALSTEPGFWELIREGEKARRE